MIRLRYLLSVLSLVAVVALAWAPSVAADAPRESGHQGPGFHVNQNGDEADVNACSTDVPAGAAHCDAHIRIDAKAKESKPSPARTPASPMVLGNGGAYDPAYLQSAYNLAAIAASGGGGQTVAIVDANDDPNAESDLAYYRNHFGLPACTTANGCFRKVDQNGGTNYPSADSGWAEEISLDLDMVSAICPNCHILLVEANSSYFSDLGVAVNRAAALGANAISNSYGGTEWSSEASSDSVYNHPGIAITASTGDSGYGAEYPAASPYVTAVGGTHLTQNSNTGTRNGSETVWSGSGSGCSAYEAKPSWQMDTGCSKRTIGDVAAVADPNTGVWVYDTYGGDTGMEIFGGTSAAAPIIAATYALAGNGTSTDRLNSYPYAHTSSLNDVTSGSNGSCRVSYLCHGVVGFDGPTGFGTPNGITAFAGTVTNTPPPVSAPVVSGLNPTSGTSGTSVTINGSGFTGASAVKFGNTAATSYTVSADNKITATAPAGSGTVDVTVTTTGGTSATSSNDRFTYTTVVNNASFSLSANPSSQSVRRGRAAQYSVGVTPSNGFSSSVSLSASGLPSGASASFSPTAVAAGGSSTLTVRTSTRVVPGTYTLTISGSGGGVTQTTTVTLTVTR